MRSSFCTGGTLTGGISIVRHVTVRIRIDGYTAEKARRRFDVCCAHPADSYPASLIWSGLDFLTKAYVFMAEGEHGRMLLVAGQRPLWMISLKAT